MKHARRVSLSVMTAILLTIAFALAMKYMYVSILKECERTGRPACSNRLQYAGVKGSRNASVWLEKISNNCRNASLKSDVISNSSRNANLKSDVIIKSSRNASLKSDVISNNSRNASLKSDVNSNSSRKPSITSEMVGNRSRESFCIFALVCAAILGFIVSAVVARNSTKKRTPLDAAWAEKSELIAMEHVHVHVPALSTLSNRSRWRTPLFG